MTEKDIRPIPKYILNQIRNADNKNYPTPDGHVRCYAYLSTWKNELVKVTVAVKHRYKKWYCKQVAVHGLDSEKCFVKDMEYCYCSGMGFRFGWYDEGLQKYEQWFERGWCWADDKYYDPYATLINPHFIDRLPEFKYSAYKLYHGFDIFKYLRLYRQYPQLEMLMKLGFTSIAMSTTILKRCGTDKAFCKWLIANQPLLQERHYYIDVIVRAYRTKKSLDLLQSYKEAKLKLIHDYDLKPIKELFKGKDLERFFDYMAKQQTNPNTYQKKRTVFPTISNAGTISVSTNTPRKRLWKTRKSVRNCMRNSPQLRRNTCPCNTRNGARLSASSQEVLLTLSVRAKRCTIA